jgi:hypothetical protein
MASSIPLIASPVAGLAVAGAIGHRVDEFLHSWTALVSERTRTLPHRMAHRQTHGKPDGGRRQRGDGSPPCL